MTVAPISSNSVYISLVHTGCCKAEFDSTYPIHLNGIINEDEYRQSINKINHRISSNKILIVSAIGVTISTILGIIFCIASGITSGNSLTHGSSWTLIGVGLGVMIFGGILFAVGIGVAQDRRRTKIRQAVAQESMKYSSRSPIPCSWRLETTSYAIREDVLELNRIVIDIGRSTVSGNEIYYMNHGVDESRVLFGQQDYSTPPPPYSDQSAGFCSQCGVSRHDLTAKFCSSCGQAFNKY